jgi:hypothetical protein
MITIYILLGLSVVFNLLLAYGIFNLLRKNTAIEDLMIETVLDTKEHVQNALLVMENSDIKGSFEADDEVGVAFQDIKTAITELTQKF